MHLAETVSQCCEPCTLLNYTAQHPECKVLVPAEVVTDGLCSGGLLREKGGRKLIP